MKVEAKISLCFLSKENFCKETVRIEELEKEISKIYFIPEENIEVVENPSNCQKRYISAKVVFDDEFIALAAVERVQYFFQDCRLVERKIEFTKK